MKDTRALPRGREATPFAFQPTAGSLLLEFGWGTGLSAEEAPRRGASS